MGLHAALALCLLYKSKQVCKPYLLDYNLVPRHALEKADHSDTNTHWQEC